MKASHRLTWLLAVFFPPWSVSQDLAPPVEATAAYSGIDRQIDVMVPMRDGIRLATDIYRPAAAGKPSSLRLPILLHRTPYDKSAAATVAIAETLARHGY